MMMIDDNDDSDNDEYSDDSLQAFWLGMFATAGSSARVAGPLLVTEIYEQLGSYWMLGIVAILMVSSPVICENITNGNNLQGLSFLAIVVTWKYLVPASSKSGARNIDTEENHAKKANDDRKIIPPEIKVNNAFIEEEEEDKESQISDGGEEKTEMDSTESIQEFGRKIITYE